MLIHIMFSSAVHKHIQQRYTMDELIESNITSIMDMSMCSVLIISKNIQC